MQKLNRTTPVVSPIIFVIGCVLIGASPAFAQYSSPVRVLNTTAQPMPIIMAPIVPRYLTAKIVFNSSSGGTGSVTTPIGGRFVVDHLSIEAQIPTGAFVFARVYFYQNGTYGHHAIVLERVIINWSSKDYCIATLKGPIIVDSNSQVTVTLATSSTFTDLTGNEFTISGHQFPE